MSERNAKKRGVAIAVIVILCALFIAGTVWTITQAVKQIGFERTYGEITEIQTGETTDGMSVVLHVYVKFEAGGRTYEKVDYIGDFSRCKQGMTIRVYYRADDPAAACYQRASDLGFALILMLCSLAWIVVAAIIIFALRRTGDL